MGITQKAGREMFFLIFSLHLPVKKIKEKQDGFDYG